MTAPITNTPALAAERVRQVLAAAGFPAARTGTAPDFGARPVATAGYVVTEGDADHGPRVEWDQRIGADAMEAKLEQLADVLEAAGLRVAWDQDVWALQVSLPVTP